jgi:hypothetical protein
MSEDTSGIIVVGLVVTTVGVLAIDYVFSDPGESYVDRITKKLGGGKKKEEEDEEGGEERRDRRAAPPDRRMAARPTTPAPRTVARPPVRPRTVSPPPQRQMLAPPQRQMFAPSERPYTPPRRRPIAQPPQADAQSTPRTIAPPPPSKGSDVVREVQGLLNAFDLRQIQSKLKAHGFPSIPDDVHLPLYVDGILGKDTSRTLAVIQQQLSLPATGAPDPLTVKTLREHAYQLQHSDEGFGPRVLHGLEDMFSSRVGAEGDWKSETASLGSEAQAVIQKIMDSGDAREKQALSKLLKDAGFSAASVAMGGAAGASHTGFWEFPPWGGPWGSGDPLIDVEEGPDFGPWGTWGFDGYSYSPWNYDGPNYMGWWTPLG